MSTFPLFAAECNDVKPVAFCWHGFAWCRISTFTMLDKFASEDEIESISSNLPQCSTPTGGILFSPSIRSNGYKMVM